MREPKVTFEDLPPAGYGLIDDGFKYWVVESRPHVTREGADSMVVTWAGICAEDGETFTFKAGRSVYNFPRRCPVHAKGKGWARVKPFGSVEAGLSAALAAMPAMRHNEAPASRLTAQEIEYALSERFEAAGEAWAAAGKDHDLSVLMGEAEPLTRQQAWRELFEIFGETLS